MNGVRFILLIDCSLLYLFFAAYTVLPSRGKPPRKIKGSYGFWCALPPLLLNHQTFGNSFRLHFLPNHAGGRAAVTIHARARRAERRAIP